MATASLSATTAARNTIIFRSFKSCFWPSFSSNLQNPLQIQSFYPKYYCLYSRSNTKQLTISAVAKTINPQVEVQDNSSFNPPTPNSAWSEFASKVSGEWDGHGADFTINGTPVELPESIVPEAFREWEVKVFDWQTQCPTLADPNKFHISCRVMKLLPTVGCEADAATIHSIDERNVGGEGNNKYVLGFGYQNSGSYVAVWPMDKEEHKVLELEHCLFDPKNKESRIRILQVVKVEGKKLKLVKIKVFCEQWYGEYRNGEQLGGCAIRDSGFAGSEALNVSEVARVWQSCESVASFEDSQNVFQELVNLGDSKREIMRNKHKLITLPQGLWCSIYERENEETCAEVGWLLDDGRAISSRCIFSNDGKLKEMVVGHDNTVDLIK